MKKLMVASFIFMAGNTTLFSQNTGIGVLLPQAKLDIHHASTISSPTLRLYDLNAGNYTRLQFQNASGINYWQVAGFLSNTNIDSRLNFYNSVSGNVMSLTGDGNVGIGTLAPATKLDVAGNARANSFKFTIPRPFYYSLGGAEFDAINSSQNVLKDERLISISGQNGVVTNGIGLVAPLHLPDGATILSFKVFFTDFVTQDLKVTLVEYDPATDFNFVMGGIQSSGTPGQTSLVDSSIFSSTIDNQNKSYRFLAIEPGGGLWPPSGLVLRSIMITYTVTEAQ